MTDDNEDTSPVEPGKNDPAPQAEEERNVPVDEEAHALKTSYLESGPRGGCRQCW